MMAESLHYDMQFQHPERLRLQGTVVIRRRGAGLSALTGVTVLLTAWFARDSCHGAGRRRH